MKVFDCKKHGISRKFLPAASAYRRNAKDRPVDFSAEMMKEQYEFESRGIGSPNPAVNGYTCGKWIMDATLAQIKEDLMNGLFAKHEFRDAPAMMRRIIKTFPPSAVFWAAMAKDGA